MKPNTPNNSQNGASPLQQGTLNHAPNQQSKTSQEAAARIIRAQIDSIYDQKDPTEPKPTKTAIIDRPVDSNTYEKTYNQHTTIQPEQWKNYHTAWQNYYQKYYEGYYTQHLKLTKQQIGKSKFSIPKKPSINNTATDTNISPTIDEEIFELRQELKSKARESANKIKKSRHFIPIISGLVVFLLFIFLQYNRVIVASVVSYISPGNIDPQNIIIDPQSAIAVGPAPRLIIPKINVDVPVSYDIGNDYDSQMKAMESGVAHFAIPDAYSHPGQIGNTVIAGHSSNDLLGFGNYKFIFAQLDKLEAGDIIYANYKSVRYTYTVTGKEVVKPNDVNKLIHPETNTPILTLLTCTPLGTAINRLLVTAEQISPDPTTSVAATSIAKTTEASSIPGNSPTLLEMIFGRWD
jgi:sortase A